MKTLLILAVGVGIGYVYGFEDAKAHRQTIVERIVERIGGSNRDSYRTDVDRAMDRAERAERAERQ
jgi:hypothetical protein